MVFGSLVGRSNATELKDAATSDTVLPDEDDVSDMSSGTAMVDGILSVGWWTGRRVVGRCSIVDFVTV